MLSELVKLSTLNHVIAFEKVALMIAVDRSLLDSVREVLERSSVLLIGCLHHRSFLVKTAKDVLYLLKSLLVLSNALYYIL